VIPLSATKRSSILLNTSLQYDIYLRIITTLYSSQHLATHGVYHLPEFNKQIIIRPYHICKGSRDSVVGTETRYGLEGPGIESRWGEIFRTYPDRLRGPPSLLYNGYRIFPGGKGGRGVMLTIQPLLAPRLRKSCAIPPLTL
jgi:hypothetical protein